MKITLLHYASPPVVGGVESVLWHHARMMTGAGHTVQIVAGRGEQVDERIRFISIPLVDSQNPEITALKPALDAGQVPPAFEALVEQIEQALRAVTADSDWLIAHNVCSLNKNLPLTAALKRLSTAHAQPRLMLWHHDLAWVTPRYQPQLHAGYPWDLLRVDWPETVQVVVSAMRQRELADLTDAPLERIHVVQNGVDLGHFLKLEPVTQELVQRLDLQIASPLLLLPVRITPRKNIEFALQVLAVLLAQFPAARLVVTGPLGPHNPGNIRYFERLKGLRHELGLDGCVHFLAELNDKFLPDAVVSDFYALADILIFPSHEEGFGIPLLEAGLAGIPVFCADIPPLREIGTGYVNFFAPEGDPVEVASHIAQALSVNQIWAFRDHVRKSYTWEQIYIERIEPLLKIERLETK